MDIGAGLNSPLGYCKISYSVGVDIFEPSVRESRRKKVHSAYIVADINRLEFKPNSFDAVVACEVLEHLDKEDGLLLLERMEVWARKKVLVSCPNGYFPQAALYGNPHQVHRSGWDIEEIKNRGYSAYGLVGLRLKPSRFLFFPLAFWAVISVMLQTITYHFPKIAFDVFYVKKRGG
ncbi:MAG: class I SAM-dependent methyltransferase [Candidatus Omnitrophota bacterium]|nr:class I SAM-dependent methyltransferase [Candidatus Omnitrophota bacterium]